MMTMPGTALLADPGQMTPEGILGRTFPVVFRGYDRELVNQFRSRVSSELARVTRALEDRAVNEQELAAEVRRLDAEVDEVHRQSRASQPTGEHAVSVLAGAQSQADQIVNGARAEADRVMAQARHQADAMVSQARHEAGQLSFHARQQADHLLVEARDQGREERMRIIATATEDGIREAERIRQLAHGAQGALQEALGGLLVLASDLERQARPSVAEQAPANQPA